jgi:glycosyltransferase involved in cell wall biosynthesis
MNKNLVSIVMPTYNRAHLIGKAIDSILKQSHNNWELIVVDNQSTDNTRDIVESFVSKDSRIRYFNVEKSSNQGLSEYLNYGIKIAEGEFIARLDDDDEWNDKDKLSKQVNFLNENKDYILVGGGAIVVDENSKELYRFFKRETDAEIRKNALYANPFCHSTVLFRKEVALKAGGYKNLIFGEDWDLWLRLGKTGMFYNFREYFALYLNSGQSFSVRKQKFLGRTVLKIIKKYRKDYPNFKKAFVLNFMQYLYSFAPSFIKKRTQIFLIWAKRNYF